MTIEYRTRTSTVQIAVRVVVPYCGTCMRQLFKGPKNPPLAGLTSSGRPKWILPGACPVIKSTDEQKNKGELIHLHSCLLLSCAIALPFVPVVQYVYQKTAAMKSPSAT
eukprot:scaffold676699_cov65-Prasinocladus_malaysianus.AAC.1